MENETTKELMKVDSKGRLRPTTHNKRLSEKDIIFCNSYVRGDSIKDCLKNANLSSSPSCAYDLLAKDYIKDYIQQVRDELVRTAAIDVKWLVARCMTVFVFASEIIQDDKGNLKLRDPKTACSMAKILSESLPDFSTKVDVTVKQLQTFNIGEQEISFY